MHPVVVVVVTFVVMEPVTYAAHRWLMHGVGMAWHRSHHARWRRPELPPAEPFFERNDLFPVCFAATTVTVFTLALNVPVAAPALPVAIGVTMYGAAYAFVHDVYIHRRVRWFGWRTPALDRLADAHDLHHRFGGEPYGMLVPVVPAALRARARRSAAVG